MMFIDRLGVKYVAQPLADLVMRFLGRGCYWLASQFAVGSGVLVFFDVGWALYLHSYRYLFPNFLMGTVICLLFCGALNLSFQLYRTALQYDMKVVVSPVPIIASYPFKWWLPMVILAMPLFIEDIMDAKYLDALGELFYILWMSCFTMSSWLFYCRPRTPEQKRARLAFAGAN